MVQSQFISIVVPTYNRKKDLKRCLNSLLLLNYPKKSREIVIVDDGSDDGTEDFVKKFRKNNKNIIYLKQKNSGPAKARNKGFEKAKGRIIFFVDDDVLVNKDLVKRSLKWYRNKKLGGVGGYVLPKNISWSDLYYIARYLDEYLTLIKLRGPETEKGLATALCSYRREALMQVKGFDENFPLAAGEDIDLTKRVLKKGWIIVKDPSIKGEHLRSETFRSVLKLKFKRMSGAVIHKKLNKNKESPYGISRTFEQWKNFKVAKRKFVNKKISFIDFLKFIYLTLMLVIVSKFGEIYFERKLKK